jgi:hypothetical protein
MKSPVRAKARRSGGGSGSRLSAPVVATIGPLPPPLHEAARVTEEVARRLELTGVRLVVVNTAGRERGRGWRHHTVRIRAHLSAATTPYSCRRAPARSAYVAGAGGLGLWYSVGVGLPALCWGYRLVFHNHAFSYLTGRSVAMRWIVHLMDEQSGHVVLCERMGIHLRRAYPRARGVLVCSNAVIVGPPAPGDDVASRPASVGPVTLGHLSNLSLEKGADSVVETLRTLRRQNLDVRLLLAGPTSSAQVSRMMTSAKAGFGSRIEYLGPLGPSRVPAFLKPAGHLSVSEHLPQRSGAVGAPRGIPAWRPSRRRRWLRPESCHRRDMACADTRGLPPSRCSSGATIPHPGRPSQAQGNGFVQIRTPIRAGHGAVPLGHRRTGASRVTQ